MCDINRYALGLWGIPIEEMTEQHWNILRAYDLRAKLFPSKYGGNLFNASDMRLYKPGS
jgi:hypothetical protein